MPIARRKHLTWGIITRLKHLAWLGRSGDAAVCSRRRLCCLGRVSCGAFFGCRLCRFLFVFITFVVSRPQPSRLEFSPERQGHSLFFAFPCTDLKKKSVTYIVINLCTLSVCLSVSSPPSLLSFSVCLSHTLTISSSRLLAQS